MTRTKKILVLEKPLNISVKVGGTQYYFSGYKVFEQFKEKLLTIYEPKREWRAYKGVGINGNSEWLKKMLDNPITINKK